MANTKGSRKRCWCISILTAVVIVVIIAIVVPLAVILPHRGHGKKSTVLLPLYIYPETETTWDPLYDAVKAHPKLNFTVVVNPSSGPGSSQYPNSQYTLALQKLTAFPNVRPVGYVRTGKATRNITQVLSEVSTYAGWSAQSDSIAMHGIFFDEAPYDYSTTSAEYLSTIDQAVKNATGLQGDRLVIHNPGTIIDPRLNNTNTDITVVFEDSITVWDQDKEAKVTALPADRSGYSLMINSVSTSDKSDLAKFVDGLSQTAEYLFVTNNDHDFYESFGTDWDLFIDVVPT